MRSASQSSPLGKKDANPAKPNHNLVLRCILLLANTELALSAAVLANPLEVFRQPARDWNENDLRHIVGMKRSKLVLKR